tara:strand:+ start:7523 stop:7954 length:432 start_codon:yes stop_codon:yes gene_type:complete
MNRGDLIRLTIFSFFLILIFIFYYNIGFLTFTNANIDENLPEPIKNDQTIKSTDIKTIDEATLSQLDFELVGIRGNNPESTIIILDKGKYIAVIQGSNVTPKLIFSHVEGSRAYFFDGKNYTFLDIIGTDKSFDQERIDLTKE